jgi:uncharacterized protein (DUF305 family)
MTLFSHPFTRKRVVSSVITVSVVAASLVLAHRPTSAHRLQRTVPIQYVADRPDDGSDEATFLSENEATMNRMMAGMTVKPTGDVDRDFVAMMVTHHQDAIDMAQAVLRYGRNEEIRRLAKRIVVAQQREIAAMRLAVGEEKFQAAASLAQPGVTPTLQPAALDGKRMPPGSMSPAPMPQGAMRMQ